MRASRKTTMGNGPRKHPGIAASKGGAIAHNRCPGGAHVNLPVLRSCEPGVSHVRRFLRSATTPSRRRLRSVLAPFSTVFRRVQKRENAAVTGLFVHRPPHNPIKNGENGRNDSGQLVFRDQPRLVLGGV